MNIATKTGIAIGPLSAVLLLSACGPTTSASGSSSPSGAPPAPASAASSPSPGAATAGATASASASPPPGAATAGAVPGQHSSCDASQLKLEDGVGGGPGTDADGRAEANFNLVNSGSSPCDTAGFPGVDLIGIDKATGKQMRFSLQRSGSQGNPTVTVSGSNTASFGILYAASVKSSTEFDATEMIMTPPNTYTPMTHKFASPLKIELLGGNPNAEVGPVGSGGHN